MSFMQPEIIHGHFQIIRNTNEGDICTPEHYAQYPGSTEAAQAYGVSVDDVETVFGWGARLSASGYLDCTEWATFDTKQEAARYLLDTYGCNDDSEPEEWEAELEEIANKA